MSVTEEHEDIKRIRHRAADASMGFGLIAILIGVFTGTSTMLPGYLLIGVGGLIAIGVYATSDTTMSRWFTLWSASMTVLGVLALLVVSELAG